ncbi:MAG: hypothetical protein EHM87_24175 [Burkholderiales bacterium]|nr:MAG: hypothetical protein EHM87_24175 [Burkholderiales bacterium]
MANALLLRGIVAYTARLEVRFLKPVLPDVECRVIGAATQQKLSLHSLEAKLFQDNVLVASATSVFFEPGLEGSDL